MCRGSPARTHGLGVLFLAGLRHDADRVERMFEKCDVRIEDSELYQRIYQYGVERGRAAAEAYPGLVALIEERFGPGPPDQQAALGVITDPDRQSRIVDRVPMATRCDDLLATP